MDLYLSEQLQEISFELMALTLVLPYHVFAFPSVK